MRRLSVSIVSLFFISAAAFLSPPAVSGEDLFDAVDRVSQLIPGFTQEESAQLYNSGRVSRFFYGLPATLYLPDSPVAEKIVAQINEIDPTIGVETVHLFEAPGLEADDDTLLAVYNMIRKVSTLEGIEYFSTSRQRMRTLFAEFHSIHSLSDPTKIEDPQFSSIPAVDTQYAFQKDLTFGKSFSKMEFRHSDNRIALSITNMTPLRYMLIPLIPEEMMQFNVVIHLFPGYILFYGNCSVHAADFLGLAEKKKESFSTRIDALYRWFTDNYTKTF